MADKKSSKKQSLLELDVEVGELTEALKDPAKAKDLMKARGWSKADFNARATLAVQKGVLVPWDGMGGVDENGEVDAKALIQWDNDVRPAAKGDDAKALIQWDNDVRPATGAKKPGG